MQPISWGLGSGESLTLQMSEIKPVMTNWLESSTGSCDELHTGLESLVL